MKVRTSITLEDTTLRAVDEYALDGGRSRLIETAILEFLALQRRRERDARDVEVIERNVKDFETLMADVLGDQVDS